MDYRDYRKKYGGTGNGAKREPKKREYADREAPDYSRPSTEDLEATRTRPIRQGASGKRGRKKSGAKSAGAKILLVVIIFLAAILALMTTLLVIAGSKIVTPSFLASKVTAEAGRASISASDFLLDKSVSAEFAPGNSYSLSHVGTYPIKISVDGKTYSTVLVVRDTVAPYAEAEPATVRKGESILPSLCLKNIADATDLRFEFKTKPDFETEGLRNVTVVITDEGGNVTEVESSVNVIGTDAVIVSSRTIECGSTVPDVSAFIGTGGTGEYLTDVSQIKTSQPGTYVIEILSGGKTHEVTLTVLDTVAPTATVNPQSIFRTDPVPEDPSVFLSDIRDVTFVTVSYDPVPVNDGNFPIPVRLKLSDTSGNTTYYETVIEESTDFEPPVITVLNKTVNFTIGDADLVWRDAVSAKDNSGGKVTLTASAPVRIVNGSPVAGANFKTTAGKYLFTVTAEDPSGNRSSVELELYVRELFFTDADFRVAVAKFVGRMTNPSMTLTEKIQALYTYLSANSWSQIHYTNDSQHDDWMKEAYSVMTKIPNSAKTDCFGFAAVAKAALEYFGCEAYLVERNPRSEAGTHFWVVYNLGTAVNPRWYHFDGTPMRSDFKIPAWALTDSQLAAYTRWRDDKLNPAPHYYQFDRSIYAYTPSTEVICPTPQIAEKYYS
ncbi:MAG: transglutaminase domain-containing protein [Clostridia bacterium]|nr:transglutaminase domain-containing protein [Clostridia bacterium]